MTDMAIPPTAAQVVKPRKPGGLRYLRRSVRCRARKTLTPTLDNPHTMFIARA